MRRFVLVCGARSGSTLVWTSLQQHPAVGMTGEIFGTLDEERRAHPIGGRWCGDEDGAAYLRDVVWAQRGFAAVGFKLFYAHAPANSPQHSVWQALSDDRDVYILHLLRENRLARFVSMEVAKRTRRWALHPGEARPPALAPFSVDIEETCRILDGMAHKERAATARFSGHPFLEIGYERDLGGDFQATIARIFGWLGLEPVPVVARVVKQAELAPSQQLANYDELLAALAGTEHAAYFQDLQLPT